MSGTAAGTLWGPYRGDDPAARLTLAREQPSLLPPLVGPHRVLRWIEEWQWDGGAPILVLRLEAVSTAGVSLTRTRVIPLRGIAQAVTDLVATARGVMLEQLAQA